MRVLGVFVNIFLLLSFISPQNAVASPPDCAGVNNWATNMAFTYLKNASLISNETIDFSKTKTFHIASEKIAQDLYRQVHLVIFSDNAGKIIEIITVNDASHEECSMSDVEVFIVSDRLGAKGKFETK